MPETQGPKDKLFERHTMGEIPRTNKRTFRRGKTFVHENGNNTLLLKEGDVLWNKSKDEFYIALNVKESTGVVYFNLSELYYGFIPSLLLFEDYVADRTEIIDDPWNLEENYSG